ncbi:PorV/PorQ family protein [Balneola sp. MJW-20]|uniref:PorV/PorQ family protein n=1 Tax=Gracilimonas aurantiaca TaxID=3234185 RepID=UPI0034658C1D
MTLIRKILPALLILICIATEIQAQSSRGLQHLNISPTAFALSRSEATTAVHDGAASIFINPALLSLNPESTIDIGYSRWIADVNSIFGGINFVNGKNALALAFYSMGSGDFEQRDQPGPSNGNFTVRYLSVAGAYSRDLDWFSVGIAAQYLYEEVFLYQASGYAFNLGLARYFLDDRIKTGLSFTNLGEMGDLNNISSDLPANLRVGISADLFELSAVKNDDLPILLSIYTDFVNPVITTESSDFTNVNNNDPYFNIGLSFEIAEVVEISSGYKTQNNVRPWSFGAAFMTEQVDFNYALIPFNTGYGTVHSIGLQYKF